MWYEGRKASLACFVKVKHEHNLPTSSSNTQIVGVICIIHTKTKESK